MSDAKTPNGLRKEDVERAMDGSMCKSPYIPIPDDTAEDFTKAITVKLPNDTKQQSKRSVTMPIRSCRFGTL